MVEYLCLQAAVAAGDIARHKVLHRQAVTDALTGVANHRSFQELLEDVFKIRRTTGASVSLLLLDLDDFKRVNDTFGHQTGDRVLSAIGQCLLRNCRLNDEPARYGGEEFAMVLPDTDIASATQLAERLRAEIEALRFHGPDRRPAQRHDVDRRRQRRQGRARQDLADRRRRLGALRGQVGGQESGQRRGGIAAGMDGAPADPGRPAQPDAPRAGARRVRPSLPAEDRAAERRR